jgi:proline iminopeptidase
MRNQQDKPPPAENSGMLLSMKLLRLALACIFAAAFTAGSTYAAAQIAVYPQQDGFVDAHGVLIYYVAFGKGSPLVVVHGGPGADHTYFLPYLLPLARTHRLIFIDERGSGRSQRLQDTSQYTVENMV